MHSAYIHTSPHLLGLLFGSARGFVVLSVQLFSKLPQQVIGIQTGGEGSGGKYGGPTILEHP